MVGIASNMHGCLLTLLLFWTPPSHLRAFNGVFDAIRRETPPDAQLMSQDGRLTTLYTDRLCETIPVVPGIMPIPNSSGLMRFADNTGCEIPRWMRLHLQSFGDDAASIRAFGLDVMAALCDRLIAGGAPSLHFYTMNQAGPTTALAAAIGR